MRVTWGATGTPREVNEAIAAQAKAARQTHPDAGAVLVAARDTVAGVASRAAPDDVLSVVVELALSVTVVSSEPPPAVAMVAEEDGSDDDVSEDDRKEVIPSEVEPVAEAKRTPIYAPRRWTA